MANAELIFEHPRVLVYHGKWQDIGLEQDSIDKTLTDPPYTPHVHGNVRSCSTNGPVKVKQFHLGFAPLEDNYTHVPELLKVTKSWVLCFCALEQLGDYKLAAGGDRARLKGETAAQYRERAAAFVRSGIWRKQQAAPQLTGDRPANSCEGWALMHRRGGKLQWNGRGSHAYHTSADGDEQVPAYCGEDPPSFVQAGRERAAKRHPAQKPQALCDRLAEWFVNPGDLVLDPYAGSGALGFAALRRGASVILCDSDPEWAVFLAERAAEELTALSEVLG